ncbi:substrate-binding domain-containing protein [Yinghuangia seranimata]|uniref:substrate-binding domain-containing protein n=1 Tax=Yinghuangia seranimata TaxID=408067 RepID=UPI00248BF575|nr:substrate-binding domain-containing protein [Yinghuangia seranimata]MDI2132872.1 substrate-binding domain-containing protein [Yinghuangia seranimata]
MPRLFHARPWHAPGAIAAVLAVVLGMLSGSVVLQGPASAAEPTGPKVTLSQSTDLVNQRIEVRWSGFMPNGYSLGVYQCKGAVPTAKDCDGVNDLRPNPEKPGGVVGPVLGHEAVFGVGGSSGSTFMRVLPKADRPYLGCAESTPCVIAVVLRPAPGATKDDFHPAVTAVGSGPSYAPLWQEFELAMQAGQAAWAPISFAPEPDTCKAGPLALRVAGSSEHAMAGLSWLGELCRAQKPMTMAVTASSSQEGRDAFRSGNVDGGLTTQPLGGPGDQAVSASSGSVPGRKNSDAGYAPVTNGAIVIALNVTRLNADQTAVEALDPVNLTPRLVAKLLTNAYNTSPRYATGSWPGLVQPGQNPRYIQNLYLDPEFLAANPGRTWPVSDQLHTLMIRGVSDDTVYELTRWLLSDAEARQWLAGTPDDHGVACPDAWRTGAISYPLPVVINRVEEANLSYRPISSYWTIVDNLIKSQGPEVVDKGLPGRPDLKAVDPDGPTSRRVVAVTSLEAAERMHLPAARLRNAAGQFVAPTVESITAGVNAATPGPDGVTLSNNFATTDPKAYPLTKTDVLAFPTQGVGKPLASSLDTYLAYVAGPGQRSGVLLGQLPPGYAPLTAKQKTQVDAARLAVQRAANPTPAPTTSAPPTTGGTGGDTGGGTTGGMGGSSSGGGTTGGGTTSGGTTTVPATTPAASPSASPRPKPAAVGPKNDVAPMQAVAERLRQALHGDPASLLLIVLIAVALGSAAASPVLLGIGWRHRTGRWPPPIAALIRTVRRRPAGGAR